MSQFIKSNKWGIPIGLEKKSRVPDFSDMASYFPLKSPIIKKGRDYPKNEAITP